MRHALAARMLALFKCLTGMLLIARVAGPDFGRETHAFRYGAPVMAATYKRYGPPDVIQLDDVATPEPSPHEVQVRVRASTVNRTDTGFRSAHYVISRLFTGLFKPKHTILGTEYAGDVAQVGAEVTAFRVGDRVLGYNEKTFGANAQYLCVPQDSMITHMPESMRYAQAAPMSEGAHYAWTYIQAANIVAGQRVLVNGASGGIGSAAVQLLKVVGARVIAVCGTKNLDLLRELGAERVIDYQEQNFVRVLRAEGETFDVVLDAVGKSTFGQCKWLLKRGGIYMSTELGPFAQNLFLPLWTKLFGSKRLVFPMPREKQADVAYFATLFEQGAFMPVVDRTYALDDIVEATRYVETGEKTGNVVLTIP